MPDDYRYYAFISYRHADNKEQGRQWATWLHQAIETYEVPADLVGQKNERGEEIPSRIYPIFRDEEELPAHADLGATIVRALEETRLLIVLCSPRAVASTYVAEEVDYFKKLGRSNAIIAAMIDGEPNAGWDEGKLAAGFTVEDECFPLPLQFEYDENGERTGKRAEPIAADFRINSDGQPEQGWTTPEAYRQHLKNTSQLTNPQIQKKIDSYDKQQHLMLLKIIAGILGLPLGELTRRDKEYQLEQARLKARRLRQWLGAVAVLAMLAVGAGVVAFFQRLEAVEQRNLALQNERVADEQRRRAIINEKLSIVERERAEKERTRAEINEGKARAQKTIAENNAIKATQEKEKTLVGQTRFLLDQAKQVNDKGDPGTALLLALNALPGLYGGDRPAPGNVNVLYDVMGNNPQKFVLRDTRTNQDSSGVFFSESGEYIVINRSDLDSYFDYGSGLEVWSSSGRRLIYPKGRSFVNAKRDRALVEGDLYVPESKRSLYVPESNKPRAVGKYTVTRKAKLKSVPELKVRDEEGIEGERRVVWSNTIEDNHVSYKYISLPEGKVLSTLTFPQEQLSHLVNVSLSRDDKYFAMYFKDKNESDDIGKTILGSLDSGETMLSFDHGNVFFMGEEGVALSIDSEQEKLVFTSIVSGEVLWQIDTEPIDLDVSARTMSLVRKEAPKVVETVSIVNGALKNRFSHDSPVKIVRYGATDDQVVTQTEDKELTVWSVSENRPLSSFNAQHELVGIRVSRDGRWIAGDDGSEYIFWNAASGEEVYRSSGRMLFQPGTDKVLMLPVKGRAALVSLPSGEVVTSYGEDEEKINIFGFNSAGDKLMIYANDDSGESRLSLWDAADKRRIYEIEGSPYAPAPVVWGDRLVVTGVDSVVQVRSLTSGSLLRTISFAGEWVSELKSISSSRGDLLVIFGNRTISVLEPSSADELFRVPYSGSSSYVRFHSSPNGGVFATASNDNVTVRDLTTGVELFKVPCGKKPERVFFSQDGSLIVQVERSGLLTTMKIWSVSTGKKMSEISYSEEVRDIGLSNDNKLIVAESDAGAVAWEAASGMKRYEFLHPLKNRRLDELLAEVSARENLLVSSVLESFARDAVFRGFAHDLFSRFRTPKNDAFTNISSTVIRKFAEKYLSEGNLSKTPNILEQRVEWKASSSLDTHLKIIDIIEQILKWHVSSSSEIHRKLEDLLTNLLSTDMEISPNGLTVLTENKGSDTFAVLWRLSDGKIIAEFHENIELEFDPTGQYLVASGDRGVSIWDTFSGRRTLELEDGNSIRYSPSGLFLVESDAGSSTLWDSNTGTAFSLPRHFHFSKLPLYRISNRSKYDKLPPKSRSVRYVNPEGEKIIAISNDGTVHLRSSRDGAPIHVFEQDGVGQAEFSEDGRFILTSTMKIESHLIKSQTLGDYYREERFLGKELTVWSTEKGTKMQTVYNNTGFKQAMVNPHKNVLATRSGNNLIELWSLDTGQKFYEVGCRGKLEKFEFTPDGNFLLLYDVEEHRAATKIVPILDLNPLNYLPSNRTCLTPEERKKYYLTELTNEQWIERGCPQFTQPVKAVAQSKKAKVPTKKKIQKVSRPKAK